MRDMRVLVVDPDAAAADELAAELTDSGYESFAWGAAAAPAALEWAREGRPAVVVCLLTAAADEALGRLAELLDAKLARVSGLLFCGEDAEGLERARVAYPSASFARRRTLHTAIASLRT